MTMSGGDARTFQPPESCIIADQRWCTGKGKVIGLEVELASRSELEDELHSGQGLGPPVEGARPRIVGVMRPRSLPLCVRAVNRLRTTQQVVAG
jgi:hypothetical protein